MTKINIVTSDDTVFIEGALVRAALSKVFLDKASTFLNKTHIIVDLSKVDKVDTAGLAWLLFLIEQARKNSFSLQFSHLPSELLNLAKLSGVDLFLPRS